MVKREEGVLLQSIVLDRDGPYGLSIQICVGLRELILTGALKVGERLPATRTLAQEFGVARTTIVESFRAARRRRPCRDPCRCRHLCQPGAGERTAGACATAADRRADGEGPAGAGDGLGLKTVRRTPAAPAARLHHGNARL
jgi:DNA-binding transcriptional MocR family regulator